MNAKYLVDTDWAINHLNGQEQGSADFVPFKLCGSLFEERAQLAIALWHRSMSQQGKSRRLSKPESLRYQLTKNQNSMSVWIRNV